jgi:hypothetical protein
VVVVVVYVVYREKHALDRFIFARLVLSAVVEILDRFSLFLLDPGLPSANRLRQPVLFFPDLFLIYIFAISGKWRKVPPIKHARAY